MPPNSKSLSSDQNGRTAAPQISKYSSLEFQQSVLDLIRRTFSSAYSDPHALAEAIQAVKAHLFARNYSAAFESPAYLLAYFVRWSPSRTLAYLHVFADLCPQIRNYLSTSTKQSKNVLCIGGGAGGEVLAMAALADAVGASNLNIAAVDIAHWDDVFARLRDGIKRILKWEGGNQDASHDKIQLLFNQFDILDAPCYVEDSTGNEQREEQINEVFKTDGSVNFKSIGLITILFTTNELFAQSKPRAMTLIKHIAETSQTGTLVLVLESAGSYSHIQIGSKTFPVQFLLDHTFVDGGYGWEKLVDEESVWFRLDERLKYPLQLENMRFFIRLYRKL
ncbi:hypothetical protein V1512DRAFT_261308 [Lipomyces arxii]|uniref:uncharacterized protein n=1 Tax=Lipomyces arxii TaxID=56418 RepID=UPI0034CF5195